MSIKKILVATDFSEQARAAAKHALAIAHHAGAELVLMHAHPVPALDFAVPYAVATPVFTNEQVQEVLADARKRLHDESEALKGQGVAVSELLVEDTAERGIFKAAEDTDADLIVTGTCGRHGLTRLLLGSVAQWVARRSPCDVLASRSEAPSGGYKRILVPTDFSPCSMHALSRASELVAEGGTIEVVHFWSIPLGSSSYWGSRGADMRRNIRDGATKHGEKLIVKYSDTAATIRFAEEEIEVRKGILERLENKDYDLVVMGSHGLKGVKKLILGSVAETVLRHTDHSVYIARGKEE